jgi:hypothetical protein
VWYFRRPHARCRHGLRPAPFFLDHLRHARLPSDLLRTHQPVLPKNLPAWVQDRLDDLNVSYDAAAQSLRLKAISAKYRYDLRHDVNIWYKPGDQVLLILGSVTDKKAIRKKAILPTDGPFTIHKVLGHNQYVLSNLKTRRIRETVNGSRLLPYYGQVPETESTWMLKVAPSNGSWPVARVVDRRVTTLERVDNELGLDKGDKVLQYKIRWVGFHHRSDTWRPLQSLGEIMELINEYDQQNPRPPEFMQRIEYIPRAPTDAVEPSPEAKKRRHMRARPHRGPKTLLSEP